MPEFTRPAGAGRRRGRGARPAPGRLQAGGAAPGIGFAIPSSVTIEIARELAGGGYATNPYAAVTSP
jgi:hypothetical protein